MIEFTVLGGYLGTGKTTLLNHILRHNEGRRIALLINDFGDINIDAQLVESQDDRQINLANGCVCCTLTDGFFEALENLQGLDPPPEHIVVEASGVADVQNLAQYGYGQGLQLSGVIVVADAETVQQKANDKYVAQTVRRQLAAADLVVLNKVDLCTSGHLSRVQHWLREITHNTPVVNAVRGNVPLAVLLSIHADHSNDPKQAHAPHDHQHADHEQYDSWSMCNTRPVTQQRLAAFAAALPDTVLRAKGLFIANDGSTLELQVVGKRHDVYTHPDAPCETSEAIAIWLDGQLQCSELNELAEQFFSEEHL